MITIVTKERLAYFWSKVKGVLNLKVDKSQVTHNVVADSTKIPDINAVQEMLALNTPQQTDTTLPVIDGTTNTSVLYKSNTNQINLVGNSIVLDAPNGITHKMQNNNYQILTERHYQQLDQRSVAAVLTSDECAAHIVCLNNPNVPYNTTTGDMYDLTTLNDQPPINDFITLLGYTDDSDLMGERGRCLNLTVLADSISTHPIAQMYGVSPEYIFPPLEEMFGVHSNDCKRFAQVRLYGTYEDMRGHINDGDFTFTGKVSKINGEYYLILTNVLYSYVGI